MNALCKHDTNTPKYYYKHVENGENSKHKNVKNRNTSKWNLCFFPPNIKEKNQTEICVSTKPTKFKSYSNKKYWSQNNWNPCHISCNQLAFLFEPWLSTIRVPKRLSSCTFAICCTNGCAELMVRRTASEMSNTGILTAANEHSLY